MRVVAHWASAPYLVAVAALPMRESYMCPSAPGLGGNKSLRGPAIVAGARYFHIAAVEHSHSEKQSVAADIQPVASSVHVVFALVPAAAPGRQQRTPGV
jgi:hypothetical protein